MTQYAVIKTEYHFDNSEHPTIITFDTLEQAEYYYKCCVPVCHKEICIKYDLVEYNLLASKQDLNGYK